MKETPTKPLSIIIFIDFTFGNKPLYDHIIEYKQKAMLYVMGKHYSYREEHKSFHGVVTSVIGDMTRGYKSLWRRWNLTASAVIITPVFMITLHSAGVYEDLNIHSSIIIKSSKGALEITLSLCSQYNT